MVCQISGRPAYESLTPSATPPTPQVWNWSFEQSHYALAQANASVYAGDPYHLNATGLVGDGNPGYWMARWHVAKLREAAIAFGAAFGAGSVGKDRRVRPVYAWQCGGWQDTVGLPYLLQVYGEPSAVFHSIACAPYMTIGEAASSSTLTVDEVLAGWRSYQQNISVAGAGGFSGVNYVASLSAAAAYWGLRCQAYEAGPDTVQGIDDGPPLWAKANASADPRITPIVFDYLHAWHMLGERACVCFRHPAPAHPSQPPLPPTPSSTRHGPSKLLCVWRGAPARSLRDLQPPAGHVQI